MKSLFLISHSHFGGAQELWANLVQGFRDRGHDARLFALYPHAAGEQETPADIEWNYLAPARPRGPLQMLALVRSLVTNIKAIRPDAIFTALPAANVLAPLAVGLARTGARVVTSHHTPCETYNPLLDAADSVTGRLPATHRIVAVSDAVASSHRSKPAGYRAKLMTIHNAVPPAIEKFLGELASARSARKNGQRLIVCSGRLAGQKNYPVIVKAMSHLADARLLIVGSGPDEKDLRQLADELSVSERIDFVGLRSREEALRIVSGGDVFVQMSLFEGNSLSLIEAAKLGLPLIVSDVAEQREAITDSQGRLCGMVVGLHAAADLAEAIRKMLDDPATHSEFSERSASLGAEIRFADLIDSYAGIAATERASGQALT